MNRTFFLFLLAPIILGAMQDEDHALFTRPVNTYQDEALTAASTLHHAPQLASEDAAPIRNWLTEHPDLVIRIIAQTRTYTSLQEVCVAHRANMSWLNEHEISNHARSNYVLDEPSGRYVLKISGELNRLENRIVDHGISRYFIRQGKQNVTDEEIMACGDTHTYQTMSYMPVYLRYLELQHLRPLRHVVVPPTFLLHVPGQPEELSDKHYVVVQTKTERTFQFKGDELRTPAELYAQLGTEERLHVDEARARLTSLDPEQLYELVLLTFYCGLWNLNTNIYLTPDGQIAIEDLEQPNVTPRESFYLQEVQHETPHFICFGKERYKRNVEAGINELYHLFTPDSEQAQWILAYAEQIAAEYNNNFNMNINIRRALGISGS